MNGAARILDPLARSGLRLTGPRRAVARLIESQAGPFTAADLEALARDTGVDVGRATIFRALDVLTELGAVERLDVPGSGRAYVRCKPAHHHHVVCSTCGRTEEVEGCDVDPLVRDVASRTGYRVEGHRVELYGTCPDCLADAAIAASDEARLAGTTPPPGARSR